MYKFFNQDSCFPNDERKLLLHRTDTLWEKGIKKLQDAHPDIQIYVGHIDKGLTKDAYIYPGLGDAGDRIFGTK